MLQQTLTCLTKRSRKYTGLPSFKSLVALKLTLVFLLTATFMCASANDDSGKKSAEPTSAAHVVTGTITNEKGEPLAGVSISLKGTSIGTVTNEKGFFKLEFSGDNAVLSISYVGYINQEIAVGNQANINIKLQPSANKFDEVIVTGVFDKRTALQSSIAISVIDAVTISQQAPVSTADLLKNVPGVYVNSALGEIRNTVFSRGVSASSFLGSADYYYVSMQEDGLPVTNITAVNFGPDYFLRSDATLGRLEAVRGGSASIVGDNAPGGIFNYISKSGQKKAYGYAGIKLGLEGDANPYYRLDLNFGGSLNKKGDWTY
ncbi:MAG: carboxypeptidase-like regulatory domain-containing protein, partial [Ginsengibacter sp.]